ncbi:MAG: hypothetical protein ABR922_03625 [Streptosporangiaceae bacterium]
MTDVFLRWHISHARRVNVSSISTMTEAPLCDEQAGEDAELPGVSSSDAAAQARIDSARTLPGFSDQPDCFHITRSTLEKNEWAESFPIVE